MDASFLFFGAGLSRELIFQAQLLSGGKFPFYLGISKQT